MPLPENKVAKEDTAIETGIGGIVQNTFVIDESLNNMTHILEQMVIGIDNLQEMFGEFFEKQKFLLDAQAEKKDAKDVSGGVESDQGKLLEGLSAEDLKMGMFSKIFLGAIVLYATGLDKWIRAIALPSTLKMMNLNFLKPFGKLFTKYQTVNTSR